MATLKLSRQTRVRGGLGSPFMVEALGHSTLAALCDVSIGVALEAVDEASAPWTALALGGVGDTAVGGGAIAIAGNGLLSVVVAHGDDGVGPALRCLCGKPVQISGSARQEGFIERNVM